MEIGIFLSNYFLVLRRRCGWLKKPQFAGLAEACKQVLGGPSISSDIWGLYHWERIAWQGAGQGPDWELLGMSGTWA